MQFLAPHNLWWLLVLPVAVLLYRWLAARRRRAGAGLPGLRAFEAPAGMHWRRHVGPVSVALALALMLLALARPTAPVTLPWARSTLMLALDISRSMRVADVKPTRMAAAQEAAKAFVVEVPERIDVGLVTFAGSAQVAQQPTLQRDAIVRAIDDIQMQFGTAVGNAIVLCLAELFPDQGIDLEAMTFGPRRTARPLDAQAPDRKSPPVPFTPVEPGSHPSAAIILLTDGRRTTGVDTLVAAKMAAERGVRIHVVGLGTPGGHEEMGDEMAIFMQLDEPTLRKVAEMTGGAYHHAASAEALRSVYQELGTRMQLRRRDTELTALLAAAAALVLAAGAGLSVGWYGRVA